MTYILDALAILALLALAYWALKTMWSEEGQHRESTVEPTDERR